MLELGLPRSPRFLINTVILTILLFGSYYGLFSYKSENSLHKNLTEAYYKGFWQEPKRDSSADVSLQIVWPRFVSSLVEREIVVSLTNNTKNDIEPIVIVSAIFSERTSNNALQQWLIWQTESQFGNNRYNGRSILNLGIIPPEGQVTESVWVRVAPVGNVPDRIPFDAYVQWTHPNNPDRVCETEEKTGARGEICILRVAPAPQATVSALQTVWQGIVRVLLLPPLTNLFLPLLALFLSLSYEGLLANAFTSRKPATEQHPNNNNQGLENPNRNWLAKVQAKVEDWTDKYPYIFGILGLIGLIGYALFLLWLVVGGAIGLLDSSTPRNWIWWISAIAISFISLLIIIYIQKQQKEESQELVKTQELNAVKENVQTKFTEFQQTLESMRAAVQEHVSQVALDSRLQDLNTKIAGLEEKMNISYPDTEAYTSLEAQIAELRGAYSTQDIQLVQQQLEEQIASLKKQFAEEIPSKVRKEILDTGLKERLGSKLNSITFNTQIKKFEAVIGFSLTSLDELRKVDQLIIRVEEFKESYPSEPEQARGYWHELANYFNENTHWEIKQRYQNRYVELKKWFEE